MTISTDQTPEGHFNSSMVTNPNASVSSTKKMHSRTSEELDPLEPKRIRTEEFFQNIGADSGQLSDTSELLGRAEDITNSPYEPGSTVEKMDVVRDTQIGENESQLEQLDPFSRLPVEVQIKSLMSLPPRDAVKTILNFGETSKTNNDWSKQLMITCIKIWINKEKLSPEDLGINTVEQAKLFLKQYGEYINHLYLNNFEDSVTDSDLEEIIKSCPNLNSLLIISVKISDNGFSAIAESCKNLIRLDLSDCRNLTDKAAIAIAEKCKNLISLDLSWCENLTDAAAIAIAEKCKNLTNLDLSWCKNLTDAAAIAIAENCKNLISLNLSVCKNLTDAAAIAIAEKCKNLTNLDLNWCENLTDAAFIAIAESCKNLTNLDLYGCTKLTENTKKHLKESFPRVKFEF